MGFWEKLEASIQQRDSLLCVGLDPDPARIPAKYGSVADFGRAIIDATADLACVYKPNIAFYEALGLDGLRALRDTLNHVPADIPVLLDAKRNDISSTAGAYARAVFETWGADAVTVNPYLGRDGVAPFTAYSDRGVFLLCKTSNPSAGEIQDWEQGGVPLYRHIAELAGDWADGREIGLVIGATYPQAIAEIRAASPKTWFLIPGIGAQGGELDAVLQAGLRADGMGLLINASRSILYADDPRAAARALHAQIRDARAQYAPRAATRNARAQEVATLARALFDAGCVRFGDFVLHSGQHSPVYVDLRRLVTYPQTLALVARSYARLLQPLSYDRIAAIPYAALPIGTAVALQTNRPMIYPRREVKTYGTKRQIEGEYNAGERVVLLDDLITSGKSKLEALEPLLAEGLQVQDIVVLIDRQQGGARDLAEHGYRLHAVVTLRELVDNLRQSGLLSGEEAQRVHTYLDEQGAAR
ncbi:MAG: orotidine-5'-phosphate decarboxylase [Chloroflexi bacterium]|nr:orotidine-5'-phosphate decarboxylase [Chloroflexota bacterium]